MRGRAANSAGSAAPGDAASRAQIGSVLLDRERPGEALPHLEAACAAVPGERAWRRLLARARARVGAFEAAAALYPALLEDGAEAALWLEYAWALRYAGRRGEAVAAYRAAIARDGASGEAYVALLDLGAALSPEDLAAMERALARADLPALARSHFHYARARLLERAGDAAGAWAQYARGARFRRMVVRYDPGARPAQAARIGAFYTEAFFRERAGWGCPETGPVFICGMPRSGSTLIEQALAAHGAIEGTLELPELPNIVAELVDELGGGDAARYPACLARATRARCAEAGARYLARTRPYRHAGRPYFTDKMLPNYLHVGVIQLILPNATIIDARRDARAACVSAFRQDFGKGQLFSYELGELGRHYRAYRELMARYDAILPGRVVRVDYETLVDDFEGEMRRVLARVGVAFEDGCLRFWESGRGVATASSEQVRRPIYRESLEEWRRYEAWLGPLVEALG